MRRMRFVVKVVSLALLAAVGIAASGGAVTLDPQSYYCFAVSDFAIGVQTLSAAAAAAGFVVLTYSDNSVSVVSGAGSPTENVSQMLLSADRLLVLDGDRFYLRVAESTLTYAIRPASAGLELVVSPKASIDLSDALTTILVELQDLGVGGIDIALDGVRTVTRNPLKGPAEPQDLAAKLDYALYGLVVAEDWFAYASEKGLALLGLHIEVVAEKTPDGAIAQEFRGNVISESTGLADLIVPVDQLVALARSSGVGYVRLPYVPVAP